MPWFAAHAITYFRFSDGRGGPIPVWENVLLISAQDPLAAASMATEVSRDGAGSFGGLAEMHGRPGEVVFAGIRKVEKSSGAGSRPEHGDEISYVELTAPDMTSVEALASGEAVQVICDLVRGGRVW